MAAGDDMGAASSEESDDVNPADDQATAPISHSMWRLLFVPGLILFAMLFGHDLYFWWFRGEALGRDFMNLYTAGKMALAGRATDLADPSLFRAAIQHFIGAVTLQNFSYPPHALFAAAPIALLPYSISLIAFQIAGIALFLWAARGWVPFPVLWAALTPAALVNIWAGQYGFYFGALWLAFFRFASPARSGLAAGLLTMKPHMGLLIALAALKRRQVILPALGVTALIVGASILVFGLEPWRQFFSRTVDTQIDVLARQKDEIYFLMMPTAFVAYGRTLAATVIHGVFAISALVIVVRLRPDPFAYATATFIILPYAFDYDMVVASVGFLVAIWTQWNGLRTWEKVALVGAMLAPVMTFFWAQPLVPPLLLAALWIQAHRPNPFRSPASSSR